MVYVDVNITYPKPSSIYLRGTVDPKAPKAKPSTVF